MAAKMQIFDALAVSIAGAIVAEQTQVTVNYLDGDQAIVVAAGGGEQTMAVLPAGRMMQVSFDMVVPSEDSSDMTFIEQYANCDDVPIAVTLRGNGAKIKSTGYLQKPTLTSAYGSNMTFSISWIGPLAVFR